MTMLAAEEVRRFGIEPAVALLSHSNFGSSDAASAQKMRDALEIIRAHAPTSRSTARCRATWRCRTRCWPRYSPIRT
jgi:phosphotransacetylase